MAMHAGLVATITDVDLQRVEPPAPDRREGNFFEQRPSIAHDRSLPKFAGVVPTLRKRQNYFAGTVAGAASAVPSSIPTRPKPGSFRAGWRKSSPATRPTQVH